MTTIRKTGGLAAEGSARVTPETHAHPEVALELVSVRKSFEGFNAVNGIDLQVRQGEFVTLLGPSGSGKTTTLMMIAGFTEPDEGDIRISGRSLVNIPAAKRQIGLVFQNYALFPHMTVAENVSFPLKMRKVKKAEVSERVSSMLELVQLTNKSDQKPAQLSGGQQQRVALARALIFRPSVVLLDEPLAALDRKLRERLQLELKQLQRELSLTVVLVTHDQQEALTMSDRIAVMNNGVIEQFDKPEETYRAPATKFVADFLGESNFLTCRVLEATSQSLRVDAEGIGSIVLRPHGSEPAGDAVTAMVRPEQLLVTKDGIPDAHRRSTRCVVTGVTYCGDFVRYRVSCEGTMLTSKVPSVIANNERVAVGESGCLQWNPDDFKMMAGHSKGINGALLEAEAS